MTFRHNEKCDHCGGFFLSCVWLRKQSGVTFTVVCLVLIGLSKDNICVIHLRQIELNLICFVESAQQKGPKW